MGIDANYNVTESCCVSGVLTESRWELLIQGLTWSPAQVIWWGDPVAGEAPVAVRFSGPRGQSRSYVRLVSWNYNVKAAINGEDFPAAIRRGL